MVGLFITGGIVIIARDWRFLILALLSQYILVGLMLSRLIRPDIAILGILIGAFVCPILYLSARQVAIDPLSISALNEPHNRPRGRGWPGFSFSLRGSGGGRTRTLAPTGFSFRILVGLLMILVAITVSSSFPLPNLASSVATAVYWLVLAGLATLMLTEEPLKAGHGLFTVLSGFGLFYATLESSFLLTGLWGSVNLLIALAIGYLTVVKGTGPEDEI